MNFLKKKLKMVGDPMNHIGLFSNQNKIPYKRPVIKQMPFAVNAKEVIRELEEHGTGMGMSYTGLDNGNSPKEKKVRPKTSKPGIYKSPRMQKFLDENFITQNIRTNVRPSSSYKQSIFTNIQLVQNIY